MPRDYKHRVVRRRKRRPVSPWLGMIAGLLIGLLAAVIAYFKLLAPQTPQPPTQAPAFMPETPAPPANPAPPGKAKPEEKTAVPAPPKPRFDFYTILPEMQVVIPKEELSANTVAAPVKPFEKPPEKPVETPATALLPVEPQITPAPPSKPPSRGNYFLQTDSLRSGDQAERFKAEIATLGLEASVQKVTIKKTLYHRVRVGPFADFTTLDRARALLRQHGIPSTPLMISQ
jgi:cell division protein FtsN